MFLRQKQNSEFEDEYVEVLPSEGEVRYLGNRNKECVYYYTGIWKCRSKMIKLAGDQQNENHQYGFLPCKRLVDAYYRCVTQDSYGNTIEDTPDYAQEFATQFNQCVFKELRPQQECRKYFDGLLRTIYRNPDNKFKDYY